MGKTKNSTKLWIKIWNIVTWILIAIVLLLAVALVGMRVFGLKPYAVLSGSMEPTYKTGSIVYVKSVDYKDLEVGDPITFMLDEKTVATHRIVEVIPDEEESDIVRFRTKGDNNDTADGGRVHCKNIIGKPVFSLPYLGYAADFIQNSPGRYLTIAICALLALMTFIPDLFSKENEKAKKSIGDALGH